MTVSLLVTGLLFVVVAAAGSVLRFVVGGYLNNEFPIGTLLVNVVGSLALGVMVAAEDPLPTIVGIGAIGAMSTWSVAANEAAVMARAGRSALAVSYLGLTVSSGILAAWFGLKLGPGLL